MKISGVTTKKRSFVSKDFTDLQNDFVDHGLTLRVGEDFLPGGRVVVGDEASVDGLPDLGDAGVKVTVVRPDP